MEMTVEKLANTTVRLLAGQVRYCHVQVYKHLICFSHTVHSGENDEQEEE